MAEGAPWTWSALHPNPVCGLARGSFMNLTTSIAVYASIWWARDSGLGFGGSGLGFRRI